MDGESEIMTGIAGTAVRCENIRVRYGAVTALRDIGFSVRKGELFGLIGPDGAGKTSLMRVLATLLVPDAGKAGVGGRDTVREYMSIRERIGYMPGHFSLYQDLSVEENLTFFASVYRTTVQENYAQVADIYRQLEPFKTRRAGKLSGGMKQKLALCCALIHKPEILFLDEPTTGVDPVSRKEFWDILQQLRAREITIVVSTPYMDEASLCDRVALMEHGRILSVDTPARIIAQYPRPVYSLTAVHHYEILKRLRATNGIHSVYSFGEKLHVTFEDTAVLDTAYGQWTEIRPSIEDCFIELLNR